MDARPELESAQVTAMGQEPPVPYAHSPNPGGHWHTLVDHLEGVSRLASKFADKIGGPALAAAAGLAHDLGKFHPAFQQYLHDCVYLPEQNRRKHGPDHSSAGAVRLSDIWPGLPFLVAGHHGGLPSKVELLERLHKKRTDDAVRLALDLSADVQQYLPSVALPDPEVLKAGDNLKQRRELFIRLLFSTLVDADFLDTEAHFDSVRSKWRGGQPPLVSLWERLADSQSTLSGKEDTPIAHARHEIYQACLAAASRPPGIYRLTVPTGGGKTRSALAFGLKHALAHGLDRVIVAIPYTSIIEQTVEVYREILGHEAVLEHHSAARVGECDGASPSPAEVQARLATENWDAPLVVTTNVQLFESLFANRPGACRKLHNIARSVIILDEVQTLPPELLEPTLDVLQDLVDHYKVTVVLCTATQPALQSGAYLKGLRGATEIVPEPGRYFAALKRVAYILRTAPEQAISWKDMADEIRSYHQVLVVLNTKSDVSQLLAELGRDNVLHLSTNLCGAHRQDVLKEVRRRLHENAPCRLIATQVVEAGVDIDFPVVYRAIGPLDRIVQAAGRCNREGRLSQLGQVIIFHPKEASKSPSGAYAVGTNAARGLLALPGADLHDPSLYERYFRQLYRSVETDKHGIQPERQALNYPEVAERYRLIEENTVPIVVRYHGSDPKAVAGLLHQIEIRGGPTRWLLRALQPYMINLYQNKIAPLEQAHMLRALAPELYEWLGPYDDLLGIHTGAHRVEDLIF